MIFITAHNNIVLESVLANARNSILYKVSFENRLCVLKVSRSFLLSDQEAFRDEYETMRLMNYPAFPKYYAYYPALSLPDLVKPVPAVLMEYMDGIPFTSIQHLTIKQLKKYILDLGDALLILLKSGVLYMDLHPGNLMLCNDRIRLIDFTKAYYYLTNPNPSYIPKISYQINQHLGGQQILIQALTSLILHLPDYFKTESFPASLIQLGLHPHSGISFAEFLDRIEKEWETE